MQKALAVLLVLLIGGCAAQPARPNFLARSLQDCANGDEPACAMLGSLAPESSRATNAATNQRPRSQSQKDADAIMQGINRARSAPSVQNQKVAPTTRRDS